MFQQYCTACFPTRPRNTNRSSYPSLHNLNPSIPSNEIQPLPLLNLLIALSTLGHSQNTAQVPRSARTQLTHAQHAPRAVRLLHRKSSRFTFNRCRRCVGIWLRRRKKWSVGWCGEEGAVDCWVGAEGEDESREGGGSQRWCCCEEQGGVV